MTAVLDWKQKKTLRLELKSAKKEVKIRESGVWDDIKHLFDPSKGHTMVDWQKNPEYVVMPSELKVETIDSRKQVSIPMLFGSNKSCGLIPKKSNVDNLKFSHSRVFGAPKKSLYVPKVRE